MTKVGEHITLDIIGTLKNMILLCMKKLLKKLQKLQMLQF